MIAIAHSLAGMFGVLAAVPAFVAAIGFAGMRSAKRSGDWPEHAPWEDR
jgi:hypothetical protein